MVRVTVAGRVGIDAGGRFAGEAEFGRLGRLAFAYLLCERHRPVGRDELAEILWGEELPSSWKQLVRGLAWKMRTAVGQTGLDGAEILTTGFGSYQMHLPPGAVVDVEAAAEDLEAAVDALRKGDHEPARARASAAIAVAARQFLPGGTGSWVERRQADLREVHLRGLEIVAWAAIAQSRWGEAVAAAEEAVAMEPFRESAYLALMAAHAAAGSRGEALRAYERCRRVLSQELGVNPSARTEEAYVTLLGDEPAAAPPPARPAVLPVLPGAVSRGARGILVGREPETARLEEALERAAVEGGQAVFVAGEPGIGKSSLVTHFAVGAHAQGAHVLYGRCDEELGMSYQPFAEALSDFVAEAPLGELIDHVAVHGGELARLVPELIHRLPETPGPRITDAEADRYRLFEAIASLLRDASRLAPVVVVLDDLHWAAPPTLVLLRHLLRAMGGDPIVLVGTYRHTDIGPDHPLTQTLADLRREPAVDRLVLRGLDEDSVVAFVQALRPAPSDDDGDDVAFARALHAHTAGNPFFVGELLRHLGETGGRYRREGAWTYYAAPESVSIPDGVREVVARRLHRLPEPAREVLRWASVIGSVFTLNLLEEVSETPDGDALVDALDAAVVAQLVIERGPGSFGFAHAVVRDTIYAELSTTRRARCHRRIAEALETLSIDEAHRLPALVHHFAEAAGSGGGVKAADYAMAAAHQALAQSAWENAVAFLDRGLDAVTGQEEPHLERRCDLLLMVAETWCRFWNVSKASAAARDAVGIARSLGSADRLARAVRWYLMAQAGDEDLLPLAGEAQAVLGDRLPGLRAIIRARSALCCEVPDDMTREALDLARRSGDTDALGVALLVRSWSLARTERADERLAVTEELVSAAPAEGWDGWRSGHEQRAIARLVVGDRAGFEADAAACERIGRERRFWYYQARAARWRATAALLDGRFAEVEELVSEADAVVADTMHLGYRVESGLQLARLAFELGRPEQAEAVVLGSPVPSRMQGVLGSMSALARAELGDTDAAVAQFDALAADDFRALRGPVTGGLLYLAEVAAVQQDQHRAAVVYDRFLAFAGQMVAAGPAVHCPGAVDRSLGQLAATVGRWDQAEVHYQRALRLEEAVGSPPLLARTRLWYGRMLTQCGDPGHAARARRLLTDSAETAARLGMAGVERQAGDLLVAL